MSRKAKADALAQRLREVDPALSLSEDETASEDLLRSILASDRTDDTAEAARAPVAVASWRRRRVLLPLAAAATVVFALVIGLPGGGRGGSQGAAGALDSVAAAAAAEAPAPELPYLFLKTRALSVNTASADGGTWSVNDAELREEWVSRDGSGQVRITHQAPSFVGANDRAAWEAAGKPNFLPQGFASSTTEHELPAGSFGEGAANLPEDADLLAQQIQNEAEETHKSAPVAARMLELIAEDLRNPAVNPQQRAALYRAAQQVPGIEDLGQVSDPEGRRGEAVGVTSSYSGEPTTYSLVFDPASTEVLAYEVEAQHPAAYADSEGPLVVSSTVYLDSGSTATAPRQSGGS